MFLHLQSNCQIVSLGLDHGNVKYINCFKKIVEVLKHDFCGSKLRIWENFYEGNTIQMT